jgi:hypothetical protein
MFLSSGATNRHLRKIQSSKLDSGDVRVKLNFDNDVNIVEEHSDQIPSFDQYPSLKDLQETSNFFSHRLHPEVASKMAKMHLGAEGQEQIGRLVAAVQDQPVQFSDYCQKSEIRDRRGATLLFNQLLAMGQLNIIELK